MLMADSRAPENLRVRLPEELRDDWQAFLSRKRITQQAAITAMVEWITRADDRLASMMLGQIAEIHHGELAELILREMAEGKRMAISRAAMRKPDQDKGK